MDVTEICKGCFSKKHGDEASACPYCEYEEGIVDVDGAGWKTGQLLSKRYLLGRLYMKKQDYAMWRAYDRFLGTACVIVVPEQGPKSGLTYLAWGTELKKAESKIRVMALKGIEGRWALVMSIKDTAMTRKEFVHEIHISQTNPNAAVQFKTGTSRPAQAMQPGMTIGRNYRILGILGSERVSISYLCEDILLQRIVKIKEFLPEAWAVRGEDGKVTVKSSRQAYAFKCGRESFMKECRMTAQFIHSNHFPVVYDYFTLNGTDYMVTEYVVGTSVEEAFENRGQVPYSTDELMEIMEPLLEGIQELHDHRIIHCNIAPSNIVKATDGRVMLTNMGAAKYQDSATSMMSATLLQPDFAAPEQISKEDGENNEGPWTDIYQIGAVMYYLLIGHKAMDAATRLERDNAELVQAKKYKVKLKKGWMNLLVECTELDYHFRIQTVEDLLAKLKKK